MSQSIEQRVIEIVAEQATVEPGQVTRQHGFIADLNYDSLALMETTMAIEDEFNISVSDEDAARFVTVGDAVDYVQARVETKTP